MLVFFLWVYIFALSLLSVPPDLLLYTSFCITICVDVLKNE